jgi:hypothetical protein
VALFVDIVSFYVSNVFNKGLNRSYGGALDIMGETVWVEGNPIKVIIDPIGMTSNIGPGGKNRDAKTVIFMKREDVMSRSIEKGDKVSVQHGTEVIKLRINSIEDDRTDLLELVCGSVSTGAIPR